MNAAVQCLRHTPHLAHSICSAAPLDPGPRHKPGAAPLIAGFAALLRRMDDGERAGEVTAGDSMRQAFISACSAGLPPDIRGAPIVQANARYQAQQDAGEFLHHLLDQKLHFLFLQNHHRRLRRLHHVQHLCFLQLFYMLLFSLLLF